MTVLNQNNLFPGRFMELSTSWAKIRALPLKPLCVLLCVNVSMNFGMSKMT